MVIINKINWLSKEAKEAEVYLSDGKFDIICFCHPFSKNIGYEISLPLYTINTDRVYKLYENKKYAVEKIGNGFEYHLAGQVKDCLKNQIQVGKFLFEIDTPLPRDIEEEDYVSFTCDRIDIC